MTVFAREFESVMNTVTIDEIASLTQLMTANLMACQDTGRTMLNVSKMLTEL